MSTGINKPPAPKAESDACCAPCPTCEAYDRKLPVCYMDPATGCVTTGMHHVVQTADCTVTKDEILDAAGAPVPGAQVVECPPKTMIGNWCDMPPATIAGPVSVTIDTVKLAADIAAAVDAALGDNVVKLDPATIADLCACIKAGPVTVDGTVKIDPASIADLVAALVAETLKVNATIDPASIAAMATAISSAVCACLAATTIKVEVVNTTANPIPVEVTNQATVNVDSAAIAAAIDAALTDNWTALCDCLVQKLPQMVTLPPICALVAGTPMEVTPIVAFVNGVAQPATFVDAAGNVVAATPTLATDCPCLT